MHEAVLSGRALPAAASRSIRSASGSGSASAGCRAATGAAASVGGSRRRRFLLQVGESLVVRTPCELALALLRAGASAAALRRCRIRVGSSGAAPRLRSRLLNSVRTFPPVSHTSSTEPKLLTGTM